jgi:hypothetical protein
MLQVQYHLRRLIDITAERKSRSKADILDEIAKFVITNSISIFAVPVSYLVQPIPYLYVFSFIICILAN